MGNGTVNENGDEPSIDGNIRALVDSLNAFPGIVTFSSCGGHAERSNPSQLPNGEFCVNFDVDISRGGWRSLELITYAMQCKADGEHLSITAWNNGVKRRRDC